MDDTDYIGDIGDISDIVVTIKRKQGMMTRWKKGLLPVRQSRKILMK